MTSIAILASEPKVLRPYIRNKHNTDSNKSLLYWDPCHFHSSKPHIELSSAASALSLDLSMDYDKWDYTWETNGCKWLETSKNPGNLWGSLVEIFRYKGTLELVFAYIGASIQSSEQIFIMFK